MSLRLSFPTAVDPRAHREEELTLARTTSYHQQRNAKSAAPETPDGAAMSSALPAMATPSTGRRHVVLPDPVAFK